MKDPAEKGYIHNARVQVLFGLANGINCFKNSFLVLALVQGGWNSHLPHSLHSARQVFIPKALLFFLIHRVSQKEMYSFPFILSA